MERKLLHNVRCVNDGCAEVGVEKPLYGEYNAEGLLVVPDVRCPTCHGLLSAVHLDCCGGA